MTDNEVKALELAKANGGKLTRNPAGFWQGKDGKATAETVSSLVKQKLMFYSARRDVFPKFATEATVT